MLCKTTLLCGNVVLAKKFNFPILNKTDKTSRFTTKESRYECKMLMTRLQRILVKCLNRAET